MSELRIVAHAIQRYQERYRPDASPEQVEEELQMLCWLAKPTKDKTPKGEEIWLADGVVFCVRRDRGGAVAVTVLPADAAERGRVVDCYDGIPEEVLEEFELRGTFDQHAAERALQSAIDKARNKVNQLQANHAKIKQEYTASKTRLRAAMEEYEKLLKAGTR